MRLLRSIILAIVLVALVGSAARAHDFGAMLVSVTRTSDGWLHGAVRIDPSHLPPAERAVLDAGTSGQRIVEIDALRDRISRESTVLVESLTQTKTSTVDLLVDAPDSADPTTQGLVLFSFRLRLPGDADSVRWRCDTPLGRYLFRFAARPSDEPEAQWLDAAQVSDRFAIEHTEPPAGTGAVIIQYTALGFTHILPDGFDHILFILGLFLMSTRLKQIVAQATAFTLAHSVTLALAVAGVIHPSSGIVEPLIAASIAIIGIENIIVRKYTPRRLLVAFGFGLVHGLGFAGVLGELGIPRGQFAPALLSFNFGVELGQLTVILAALLAVGWASRKPWYRARCVVPASACIAAVALFWTVQRLAA